MNRKADVPMILVPAVALLLCIIALFILVNFDNKFTDEATSSVRIAEEINFNHKYVLAQAELIAAKTFASCPSCSEEQIKTKLKEESRATENKFRYEGAGNFYAKIRNDEFSIKIENERPVLEINDLFVEATRNENSAKKEFSIKIETKN